LYTMEVVDFRATDDEVRNHGDALRFVG